MYRYDANAGKKERRALTRKKLAERRAGSNGGRFQPEENCPFREISL
jgi:hypothetical protein